jgi:hypothetical protein
MSGISQAYILGIDVSTSDLIDLRMADRRPGIFLEGQSEGIIEIAARMRGYLIYSLTLQTRISFHKSPGKIYGDENSLSV